MPLVWTVETLSAKSDKDIEAVRENATKKGAIDLVALCDQILCERKPAKTVIPKRGNTRRRGPVIGYHFVCRPQEKGVTRNPDGTVWSGTWVVAEVQAARSLKAGAYVALHLRHAEPSYLLGIIKAWRRSKREDEYADGREVKTEQGTDFLLEIMHQCVEWQGEGTVERSYVYATDETEIN